MVIKKCPYLINEMVRIITQIVGYSRMMGQHQPRLDTVESIMRLSPMIVQAIWDTKNSLLQLPHIEENHLRHFVTKKVPPVPYQ
jgi:translocation protein SEC63